MGRDVRALQTTHEARHADEHAATPTRVLYIAGCGRSGTTLIERILGQLPGVFSAGELRFLWQRGLVENRLCGCGRPLRRCPTWTSILDRALSGWPDVDFREFAAVQRRQVRALRLPLVVLGTKFAQARRLGHRERVLGRLYRAVARDAGAEVVVDSSKLPSYGALLERLPGVRVQILHVVRDPRATAFSWSRYRLLPDLDGRRPMHQQGAVKSAALWVLWNCVTEILWNRGSGRYQRVRYEDFARDPEPTARLIARFVAVDEAPLPFVGTHEVQLGVTHTVAGNPGRHEGGDVQIRSDSEWVRALGTREFLVVTAMTWPLLLRYGYPLRRRDVAT